MFSIARALRCCHQSHIANRLVRPAGIGGLGLPGSGPKSHDVLIRGKKSKAKRKEAAVEENEYDGVDLAVLEADMTKVSQAFKTSLSRLRAVGAHPEMLDGVHVMAYGSRTALQNVAQVSVRDARTLAVAVFDSEVTTAVEKGIRSAGLNLNPAVDGTTSIKVPVPRADKSSRENLAKTALGEAEKAKIATRHVRRDAMNEMKKQKDSLSKTEVKRIEKEVQKATDKFVALIEQAAQDKVKAIRDV